MAPRRVLLGWVPLVVACFLWGNLVAVLIPNPAAIPVSMAGSLVMVHALGWFVKRGI